MASETGVSRHAVVAGATGLVGGHLLRGLVARSEYGDVTALARRPGGFAHDKLSWRKVDFGALPEFAAGDVFCALGTTLKRAGSPSAFRQVDEEFVVKLAEAALRAGCPRFLLVSAVNADPNSSVFYNRVKGVAEARVSALGLPSVCIFRPSLLLGRRDERRSAESAAAVAARALGPLLRGRLRKYRPIGAELVARAMLEVALEPAPASGVRIFESDQIASLAAS